MNIAIMNRAILLNEEGTGEPLRLLENARRVVRFDVVSNGGRRPLTDEQRRAIFAKSGSRGSERAEAAARALPPWQKPQGGDRWGSEIRATTVWDKADRLLGRLMRVGDVTTTLTEDDPKWKWVLGTAAGMMLPTPGGKFKALGKVDDAADAAKGIWALARNSLARKLGLSDDLRKGLPGITDHLDNILTKTDDYDGILKQAAKDYKNGDRYIRLPDIEQKVAPVADRMAATRIQSAVKDAERLAGSIPAGHYDTALDLADKRVIDAVAAGDAPTKQYLEELWWDKKDLFRDPTTMWVDYNEMAGYLTDVVGGAGKSTVVSGMPVAPRARLKEAETLAAAKQTVADLRAAYRHKEADAVIKSMGDAWPKYVPKPEPPLTKQNWRDAWIDQYGNRADSLRFLANARRVAADVPIANGFPSDQARRAFFARSFGQQTFAAGTNRPAEVRPKGAAVRPPLTAVPAFRPVDDRGNVDYANLAQNGLRIVHGRLVPMDVAHVGAGETAWPGGSRFFDEREGRISASPTPRYGAEPVTRIVGKDIHGNDVVSVNGRIQDSGGPRILPLPKPTAPKPQTGASAPPRPPPQRPTTNPRLRSGVDWTKLSRTVGKYR